MPDVAGAVGFGGRFVRRNAALTRLIGAGSSGRRLSSNTPEGAHKAMSGRRRYPDGQERTAELVPKQLTHTQEKNSR
jgi:hypothetical protein